MREPRRDLTGEPFADEKRGVSSDAEVICCQRQSPTVGLIGDSTNPTQPRPVESPSPATKESPTKHTRTSRLEVDMTSV